MMLTKERENGNHRVTTKKQQDNFILDEDLSLKEKIEKSENIICQLKEAASETADKLQRAKFEQNALESRWSQLYWKCQIYNIKHREEEIHYSLKMLEEHHDAEMQRKELLFEVNKLSHKLQRGRNTMAQEMKIQRTMKSFANETNHNHMSNTTNEVKSRIAWGLVELVKSKDSIKDIMQVLYHELQELGNRRRAYNREARHLKKKLEAVEKDIGSLQGKLEDINSRKLQAYSYMQQLKIASSK